ncbi:MAG TPA: Hsp20/alpha crystallin family protein, partial [Xylella sp.]
MNVVRYAPWPGQVALQNEIRQVFDRFFEHN